MKKKKLIIYVFLILTFFGVSIVSIGELRKKGFSISVPDGWLDAFSKLKQGDTLIVRYHTRGCFHNSTHEFTFRRATELTVSIVQLPCDATCTGVVTPQTNRVDLGTLTLSKSDVAGLDRLMEFYRSKYDGFCTTVDNITFTKQRDGKTVATEQITTDGSCQSKVKRITSFGELIGRLSSPKR